MTTKLLRFLDLNTRHSGVSPGLGASYAEAARVCLDRHHTSPAEFQLRDNAAGSRANADWTAADETLKGAWANKDDATEFGAYGLALAAIELTRGLVAVRRAETRTGSDYYLGDKIGRSQDLENSFRLEVSGTDEGRYSTIDGRLRQKLEQANKGKSNLPAIASVVGFSALWIVSADLEQK